VIEMSKPDLSALATRFVGQAHTMFALESGADSLFALSGAPIREDEVARDSGLLPLVVWYADQVRMHGTGKGFEPEFMPDSTALLGYRCRLDNASRPASEILLFLLESIDSMRAALPQLQAMPGTVDVTPWAIRFREDMAARLREIEMAPASSPDFRQAQPR
jgi:hypothetical protein